MKKLPIAMFLALLVAGGGMAHAQTACLAGDPQAVAIDTVSFVAELPPTLDGTGRKNDNNGQVIWEIIFWNTSQGPGVTISPQTVRFGGDGPSIDASSTQAIFDTMALSSLRQLVASGLLEAGTASNPTIVRVMQPGCVSRHGNGASTTFVSCDGASCCTRTFAVSLEGEIVEIRQTGAGSTGCNSLPPEQAAGCESICH